MSTPAETIYQLIKSNETKFPIPAPYHTISVGTFNAAQGSFTGLTTTVDFDPEPIEHQPGQKPVNPQPIYRGSQYISITINKQWQRTTTTVPAPIVPLAPILLQFALASSSSAWSVTVNGVTKNAPATQNTLVFSIWDSPIVAWSLQAGAKSHNDTLRIQRPAGVAAYGVGAFTIPVLPVSIVYAPPVDSLGLSTASYVQGETVGTTVTTSFGDDTSHTSPQYTAAQNFKAGLDTAAQVLGLAHLMDASSAIGAISTQIGTFTNEIQKGISNTTDSAVTVTQSTSTGIGTNTSGGGPGSGDVMHFYKNVMMAWSILNGQFNLLPIGYTEVVLSVGGMVKNLNNLGITVADAQALLAFDPFVASGPMAALPADRFTFQETWEYGFSTILQKQFVVVHDTKDTYTTKNYTTTTQDWNAGPIFQLLGFGGKSQTTITCSNATGTDVSQSITLNLNLVSGPNDHFLVNIFYDNLFGTFTFQQGVPTTTPRFQGTGATSGVQVTLTAGGKLFRTVADQKGHFGFSSPTIPAGSAMLKIGSQQGKPVTIAKL